VTIVVIGVLAALSEIGIPVASIVAGLGVGGIAIALAAKKTMENLFGSISLGVDRPLRVGDSVKIGDLFGTVETIGLRSTRIRTLDRTIVTIPNGILADLQIETFAVRDRIRLSCNLGLVFGTHVDQMRKVLTSVEALLKEHPKVWKDQVVVRFREIGSSSLNLEVMLWVETVDFREFRDIRQELLLGILAAVEESGTSFAFPTQTIQISGANPSSP
jgi:MscS family membrane protein